MDHELEMREPVITTMEQVAYDPFAMLGQRPVRRAYGLRMVRKTERCIWEAVFVRDRGVLYRVDFSTIRIIRAEGNYIVLQCDERRFVLRNSLAHVVDQLNDPHFVQVNRSQVVNIRRVNRVECDCVHVDHEIVTLSNGYRTALVERLQVLGGR